MNYECEDEDEDEDESSGNGAELGQDGRTTAPQAEEL